MRRDNPYWEAAKYAFAIAGGAAAAATMVRVGYKILKKGAESIAENRPDPIREDDEEEIQTVDVEAEVAEAKAILDADETASEDS